MKGQYSDTRDPGKKAEDFVRWFLRFNGYFSIESFIVHDPSRTRNNGRVDPKTETDILAIRMPYSHETAGSLKIANYAPLVDGSSGKIDVIIGEAKSGGKNTPNPVWHEHDHKAVEYILRFIGLCKDDLDEAAFALARAYRYENDRCRFRYIVTSEQPSTHYGAMGVTYFTYRQLVQFLVEVRAQCWLEEDIGVASAKHQWDPMIKEIFRIAVSPGYLEERIDQALDVILCNATAVTGK